MMLPKGQGKEKEQYFLVINVGGILHNDIERLGVLNEG
jgi:hypothetical protein